MTRGITLDISGTTSDFYNIVVNAVTAPESTQHAAAWQRALGIGVWQRRKAVALAGAEVVHCDEFLAAIDTRVAVAGKLDAGRSIRNNGVKLFYRPFEKAHRTTNLRYHRENWLEVILARIASFAYPRRLLRIGARPAAVSSSHQCGR